MSDGAQQLIASSWAPSTLQGYNSYFKKWCAYCEHQNIDRSKATFSMEIEFLVHLFKNLDEKYSSIAGARSMLSAVLPLRSGVTFGKDPSVSKVLKGIFRSRPKLPRRVVVYDPNVILQYMCSLPPNKGLLLERLTKKLVTLLCLLSGDNVHSPLLPCLFPTRTERMIAGVSIFLLFTHVCWNIQREQKTSGKIWRDHQHNWY